MEHSAEMVRCLESGDVTGLRRLWRHVAPHLPQPISDSQARIVMHMTRTQSSSVSFKARAYSHSWLLGEGYPSQLPDHLKPKAERMYPKIEGVVGLAMGGRSEIARAIAPILQREMNNAILECYADNKKEPSFVKKRMFEVKDFVTRKLIGRLLA